MYVLKSDGTIEDYSVDKIYKGITEAFQSINETCPPFALDLIKQNLYVCDKMQTSEIRRQVEELLMNINKQAAKAYISKFEQRDADGRILRNKESFISNYINASNASSGSKYDSNANVSNKNIATLNAEIPKQGNIQFNRYSVGNKLAKLYNKKLSKQYVADLEHHTIYKHDESSFGINSPYTYSAKETIEVKYNNKHLFLPFDLLWDIVTEEAVLVNENDGAWQKYPQNLFVKDRGNVYTKVNVITQKTRKRDLVRVKTSFGEDLIVTDNHPMIINEHNVNDTIEAINSEGHKQFKINETLEFDGLDTIDMGECPDIQEKTNVYCINYMGQPFKRFLKVDEELGYLVGFFVGDGNYNVGKSNGSIVFTQKNRETLVKLNNILFKKLGIVGNIRYKRDKYNCYNLTISNNALWWVLSDVFKIQDKSENKTLPYNILEFTEEFAKGILCGLIDADGTINDCQLSIRLSSRSAIMQATALLRHFRYGVGNTMQNKPFSNNGTYTTNYTLWGVNTSVRTDSIPLEGCDKLKNVRISDSSLKYKKDGETNITSVTKINDNDAFLELNDHIYDITTETRTFSLNNILVHNCVAVQSYPFLVNGLKGLGGLSAAPKNLDSFCGMFVNLVFAISSQFAGACLYKNQSLILKEGKDTNSKTIKDFVNSFELDRKFDNYQGEWEYKDISDKDIYVAEDGQFVKVNKVFRRKYDNLIYHVKSCGGLECFVSEDHKFKVLYYGRGIEVKAKDLVINDTVFIDKDQNKYFNEDLLAVRHGQLSEKDFLDQIQSIDTFDNDDAYVYEIETETHWYNCGGFITHNCAFAGMFNMFDFYARKEWGDDYYLHDDRPARIRYGANNEEPVSIAKQIEQYFQQIV